MSSTVQGILENDQTFSSSGFGPMGEGINVMQQQVFFRIILVIGGIGWIDRIAFANGSEILGTMATGKGLALK